MHDARCNFHTCLVVSRIHKNIRIYLHAMTDHSGQWLTRDLKSPRIALVQLYRRVDRFYTLFYVAHLGRSSDMQRLLDARGQRGSWKTSKIFSIRPAKFLMTFFSGSPNSLLECPLSAASCPGNDIFSSFFVIYLHFYENWPLGCPQGGCPGPSHRPHPVVAHW